MPLKHKHTAPPFALLNQAGSTVSLDDLKGHWAILFFYPRDNTPGCTEEACAFTALLPAFTQRNAIVLGISPDSIESHQKFRAKHALTVDLLSDPTKETLKCYGAWGLKKNYGKEYEGVIRSTVIIDPKGQIAASWSNVPAKGHAAKVLQKLEEISGS